MSIEAVNLAYDLGADDSRVIPVRLGVVGDLAGHARKPEVAERVFHRVGGDDLSAVFAEIRPELNLRIEGDRGELLDIRLSFSSLEDFGRAAIQARFGATSRPLVAEAQAGASLLDQILVAEEAADGAARQVDQVLSDESFQGLHAAWLGLAHLASCRGDGVELWVLDASKAELARDLEAAPDLEHALLYRRLYADVYREPGGIPFAALVCDYTFSTHADDQGLLRYLAVAAAAAQTPVLAAAAPALLDFEWKDFRPLAEAGALTQIFSGALHTSWRSLREVEELRFVTLTLPRWRAAGAQTAWISAAYRLGGQLAVAYRRHGWPAKLCSESPAGEPVEVECAVSAEARASLLAGGLALFESQPAGGALVAHAMSVHKPPTYHEEQASTLAQQMASPTYVAAASRVHQHMMCMARDLAGEPTRLAQALTTWLRELCSDPVDARENARRPLVLEGEVQVTEDGFADVRLRPAYQLPALPATARVSLPLPGFGD